MRSLVLVSMLGVPLVSQTTGRTMQLLAPAVVGQTATFGMTYPASATGNLYAFLWCAPPFAGTATLSVPGFTLHGAIRVDPQTAVTSAMGVLGASGTVAHSLAIPNHPSFVGYAWDQQSVDLGISTSTLWFADNELTLSIANTPLPSLNMVTIAPGTFQMGSSVTPLNVAPYYNRADAQPVHQVTITRPFWIGKYEVTQAEYLAVMNTNPSYFQGASYPNSANRPVENVTWNQAMAYCAALTAQEAAAGRLPAGYQYRLPTEAEWEYCCRAGTTTEFHYGPTLVCGQASFNYSYHTNSYCAPNVTVVVGGYAPNAWGLHDMHGNVWEWCLDWWDVSSNYPASPVVDPYVNSGPYRVYRGGSWDYNSDNCRSAHRYWWFPTFLNNNLGFRVVLAPVLV